MNRTIKELPRSTALGAFVALSLAAGTAILLQVPQQAVAQPVGEVTSLRGETGIPDENLVPEIGRQDARTGSFERAYRQQPPLIPHTIEGDQITRTENSCIQCHDWPYNVDQGAPKISETHYVNREGVALDAVSSNRWFCTQCHVPQSNAKELVRNDFKSVLDVD